MPTELRVATYNASLNRNAEGQLVSDLSTPDNAQARAVAEVIQRIDADVILINEFDFVADGSAADLFRDNYLNRSQNGQDPVDYPFVFVPATNTGVPSGLDLNGDGRVAGGNDAFGFGVFPGQFGFVIYSKYPILESEIRTFQNFLWKDMPGNLLTDDTQALPLTDLLGQEAIDNFRLSSKNHADVPVLVDGEVVHILAAHPTPPVFDGPEDLNGKRNHDEIRLWSDYVTPGAGDYLVDDNGVAGGLASDAAFVIVGDYNADPFDGDSVDGAINQFLDNPLIEASATDADITPSAQGGVDQAAAQGALNLTNEGNPAFDTADFGPDTTVSNLRVDYVLPSQAGLDYVDGGIFWPGIGQEGENLTGVFPFPTSDHRAVFVDLVVTEFRNSVTGIEFLGEVTFATGLQFEGTTVGGLSGLFFDPVTGGYRAISDDRGEINTARIYDLDIDLTDGALDAGDVTFTDVTLLSDESGTPYTTQRPDFEGIAQLDDGTLVVSNERLGANDTPGLFLFDPVTGQQTGALPVDARYDGTVPNQGVRTNLAFESLTTTPDGRFLYTAVENALEQDGPVADTQVGTPVRIIQYDTATGQAVAEYVYVTEPVADQPVPAGSFATNGLVELLAIDDNGTLLAMERSFSNGVGNAIKIFQIRTQGATNVIGEDAIPTAIEEGELSVNVDAVVTKTLVLDLADLGIVLDNVEGMTLGPVLPDGRQSLILISDNNFSATQFTQVLAFAIDIDGTPLIEAVDETPSELRYDNPQDTTEGPDSDDPAIYLGSRADRNYVITAEKNGGLRVYDTEGNQLNAVEPEGIRYNNVDLVYGFDALRGRQDLVVASDRANDTVAVYQILGGGRLRDVTGDVPASIFGVDDGEATALGLATYKSLVDGSDYVFVTQSDSATIAQLRLVAEPGGRVGAELVRTLTLPVPEGEDPADFTAEGIAIDRETGIGYIVAEGQLGLLSFEAEPTGTGEFTLIQPIDQPFFTADLEGVSIVYGANGAGSIVVSSQGDSSFAVFDRQTGEFTGSFAVGEGVVDDVAESDGIDIFSGALPGYPNGLLVLHDGSNDPATVFPDPEDGEIQNFDTNFKYIDLGEALEAVGAGAANTGFNPRAIQAQTLIRAESGEIGTTTAELIADTTTGGSVRFEITERGRGADGVRGSFVVTGATVEGIVDVTAQGLEAGSRYTVRVIDDAGDRDSFVFTTLSQAPTVGLATLADAGVVSGEIQTLASSFTLVEFDTFHIVDLAPVDALV